MKEWLSTLLLELHIGSNKRAAFPNRGRSRTSTYISWWIKINCAERSPAKF